MNNLNQEFDKYVRENPKNKEVCDGLKAYLKSLSVFRCGFCDGVGHTAKKCATKKTVDAACKSNPQWKVVWGSVKGSRMSALGKKRADTTMERLQKEVKDNQAL